MALSPGLHPLLACSEAGRALGPSVAMTAEARALGSFTRGHAFEAGTGEGRAPAFRHCGSLGRNRNRRACRHKQGRRQSPSHASSPVARGLSGADRASPASRPTSHPGCADHTTSGGRGYLTAGFRSARSCISSGRPRAHYWCGRIGEAVGEPPMPTLCVGIEGTVARDNADNHRFRIVADGGVRARAAGSSIQPAKSEARRGSRLSDGIVYCGQSPFGACGAGGMGSPAALRACCMAGNAPAPAGA